MDSGGEKAHVSHIQDPEAYAVGSNGSSARGDAASDFDFTPEEQRRIITKIDRRLVVTLGVLYCASLMDRTNLGSANIAGMSKELALTENRYSIVTLTFFVTYIIFQPPSTVIVRKIGPRVHLALITLLWGGCMIGMGFVRSWTELTALRIVLGVLEAGFFPSCVYLLSTWYTRYEVGKRYSVFYLIGCLASAFAGILAYGLMQMNGLANLSGWRWIFIIEGLITCLLAIGGYWLLVDFPDSKRDTWLFLGARECAWVCARVNADRGDVKVPPFALGKFLKAGLDWKIWAYAMLFFNTTTLTQVPPLPMPVRATADKPRYALAYFLPVILTQNMGFSVGAAQCLVAPPYAFAGIVMFCGSWLGDHYHVRGPMIVFNAMLCIIGLPIMGWHSSPAVRYFGVFLVTAGANANIPTVMSYQSNQIRGQWKRAFCSATLVGMGGVGGIAGSLVFGVDAPKYRPGLWFCLATSLLTILLVGILTIYFRIMNKKADRGEVELEAHEEDFQPGFRYTL